VKALILARKYLTLKQQYYERKKTALDMKIKAICKKKRVIQKLIDENQGTEETETETTTSR
jgi:hypothetical protein